MSGSTRALTSTTLARAARSASEAGLTLLRASPRGDGRLLVALGSPGDDRSTEWAGQWFTDPGRATSVADRTRAGSREGSVELLDPHLLVQREGADRRLPELHRLVGRTGSLVAHRPERRGVVRHHDGSRFTKVVPASRVAALAGALRTAATWDGVRVPAVLDSDDVRGTVTLATLPGQTLHERLRAVGQDDAATLHDDAAAVGAALARLHAVPPPRGADRPPRHDVEAELRVTADWLVLAAEHAGLDLDRSGLLRGARTQARALVPTPPVVLHRDLHDKQLLLDRGEVGVLDLDLISLGEAALDLANLLVHLELRAHQGLLPPSAVRPLADAVLEGYAPDDRTRAALPLHARLTRLRLAGVYAFRPADAEGVVGLTSEPILEELS